MPSSVARSNDNAVRVSREGLRFFGLEALEADGYLGGGEGLGGLLQCVAEGLHLLGQLGGPGLGDLTPRPPLRGRGGASRL